MPITHVAITLCCHCTTVIDPFSAGLVTILLVMIFSSSISKPFLEFIKGPLSGLRQFLATENPLKSMKNACYFTLKALFVLKKF